MLCLGYYIHAIDPIAIRFPAGFFLEGIYWYGIAYCLGFILAAVLLQIYFKKGLSPLGPSLQTSLLLCLMVGVLVGGKLGYLILYQEGYFFKDPLAFFRVWERGMASHGGFMGVIGAIFYFVYIYKQNLLKISDIAATLAPPGFFLGRIANFVNGELWGRVTDVPWAIIFPGSAPYRGYPIDWIPSRHPSQLYEACLEGLILGAYLQYRFWKKTRNATPDGRIAGECLFGYGVLRILGECFRQPDASLIIGLSRGQFYSIFLMLLGCGLIFYTFFKHRA